MAKQKTVKTKRSAKKAKAPKAKVKAKRAVKKDGRAIRENYPDIHHTWEGMANGNERCSRCGMLRKLVEGPRGGQLYAYRIKGEWVPFKRTEKYPHCKA